MARMSYDRLGRWVTGTSQPPKWGKCAAKAATRRGGPVTTRKLTPEEWRERFGARPYPVED